MRKVVAIEYVTLDNVMETPVWTQPYFSEEVGHIQDRHIQDRHSGQAHSGRRPAFAGPHHV